MAYLLLARDYIPPDPLAIRLQEELPDDQVVVVGACIHGMTIDVVVLTGLGLLVLHLCDGSATSPLTPSAAGRALAHFLADEFPGLQPAVHHLLVWLRTDEPAPEGMVSAVEVVQAIDAVVWPAQGQPLDVAARRTVGLALQERRLTSSQRAMAPFIFHTGGWLRSQRRAWTVRELVRHLDRAPEDGVFHLRNGTLARWLDEQGAAHLARLARSALDEATGDYRAALELFLLGTGLVQPPSLVVQPERLDLGKVISGETASRRLTVRRGPGRGYLVGAVKSLQPWVKVEPDRLAGGSLEAVVSVDTTRLPIRPAPYQAQLQVVTNGHTRPLVVPVQVRVVTMPSPFWRYVARPALFAVAVTGAGAILGGGAGILITQMVGHRFAANPVVWTVGMALIFVAGAAGWRLRRDRMARRVQVEAQPLRLAHAAVGRRAWAGWVEVFLALGLLLMAAALLFRPAPLANEIVAAEEWTAVRLDRLETRVDRLVDSWLLRFYDRRAPSAPLLATPEVR